AGPFSTEPGERMLHSSFARCSRWDRKCQLEQADACAALPESRAAEPTLEIAQDLAGGVVAGSPGDAASRVSAGAAEVETCNRHAVIGVAQHGTRREELIQRQLAVEDVAVDHAETPLKIERRQDLPGDDARLEIRGMPGHGLDHEISKFILGIIPGPAVRQTRRDVLHE